MTYGSTPPPYPGETRNDYRNRLKRLGHRARKFGAEDYRLLKCLEDAGIEVERTQTRDLRIVGAITRKSLAPTNYRRIAMLPYYAEAAATARAEKAEDAIEAVIGDRRRPRFIVVHPREPAELSQLVDHLDAINKDVEAISRAIKRHGGGVVWVSIEAKYQADKGTYHVHANMIVWVPSNSLKNVKDMADRRFGREGWHDAGKVRSPRKVSSYVTKAPDLRPAPAPAVVAYHEATEGRQLHRSCYHLSSEQSACDDEGALLQEPLEGPFCDIQSGDVVGDTSGSSETNETPPGPGIGDRGTARSFPIENRIIRFLGVRFITDHAEPVYLIEGYTEHPTTQSGWLGLARLEQAAKFAKDQWLSHGGSEDYFSCPIKTPQNPDPQLFGPKRTERDLGY